MSHPLPKLQNKFTAEGYMLTFKMARAIYTHRFVSKQGKTDAALLMYLAEKALGGILCDIPKKCLDRHPRSMFVIELNETLHTHLEPTGK